MLVWILGRTRPLRIAGRRFYSRQNPPWSAWGSIANLGRTRPCNARAFRFELSRLSVLCFSVMDRRLVRKRALDTGIEAADAELAELRRARRAAKEADARRRRREEREWVLTVPERRQDLETVLAIFMLGDYAPEPVVVFLRGLGRQYHWEAPKTNEELLGIIEAAFLAEDLARLASLCDEDNPTAALRAAASCVAQWRSVVWSRGTSAYPYTEAIAVEYESVRATFAEDVRPPLWHGAPGARKRGTRLRRRWGGRCGPVRPREILPAAEMLAKVARLLRFATFYCRPSVRYGPKWKSSWQRLALKSCVRFVWPHLWNACVSVWPCSDLVWALRATRAKIKRLDLPVPGASCCWFFEILLSENGLVFQPRFRLWWCGDFSIFREFVDGIRAGLPAQIPASIHTTLGVDPNIFRIEKPASGHAAQARIWAKILAYFLAAGPPLRSKCWPDFGLENTTTFRLHLFVKLG